MKERPILFSAPMVRAILDGSKTQTRRIVKLPHANPLGQWKPTTIGGEDGGRTIDGKSIPLQGAIWHTRTGDCIASPYGQPGGRLWVRETFFAFGRWETRYSEKKRRDEWHFVDMTLETGRAHLFDDPAAGRSKRSSITPTWWKRPAIHMPRRASRILLEVTGVRVELLKDISDTDAIAEGIYLFPGEGGGYKFQRGEQEHDTARDAYRDLWEQINGAGSWDANPWVWVIELKRIAA